MDLRQTQGVAGKGKVAHGEADEVKQRARSRGASRAWQRPPGARIRRPDTGRELTFTQHLTFNRLCDRTFKDIILVNSCRYVKYALQVAAFR